ncbi:hypothetical protein ALO99_00804 [Pseudomonas coronafaciens pv. porri]|nr:hypothetical protein ALO99_00804 [Pseudomonas coronafaciens pv. porri]
MFDLHSLGTPRTQMIFPDADYAGKRKQVPKERSGQASMSEMRMGTYGSSVDGRVAHEA